MKDDQRLASSRRLRQLFGWGMAPEALCGGRDERMKDEG